jgi:hypothetical protein
MAFGRERREERRAERRGESTLTPEDRRKGKKGKEGIDFPGEPRDNPFPPRDDVDPNTKGENDYHERRTRGRADAD